MSTSARVELRGPRVVLRAFRSEEIDEFVAGMTRPDAAMPMGPPPREELRRRALASGRMMAGMLELAVEADGRLVGEVQARQPRQCLPPGVFALGIGLFDASDRGRGVGTEAIGLLTEHLFAREGAARVELSTDVDNGAMRRTSERLGFALEGVMRGFMPSAGGGGRRDYALYAMTRNDWENERTRWTFRS